MTEARKAVIGSWVRAFPGLRSETWGTPILHRVGKGKSRFPSGMTDKKSKSKRNSNGNGGVWGFESRSGESGGIG
jgi:hypothetical protein